MPTNQTQNPNQNHQNNQSNQKQQDVQQGRDEMRKAGEHGQERNRQDAPKSDRHSER